MATPEMTQPVKVSVVIPTYNDGDILSRAITSVLLSEYPVEEIVIIDDGSSDDSAQAVVNSFRKESIDERPRFIFHKKTNGGPSSARNMGIKLSCGEWIAFLDADDEMLPVSINAKIGYLRMCNQQNIAGIYGSFIWSNTGKVQFFEKSIVPVSPGSIGIMGKAPGGAPAYLLNKNALLRVDGFDESLIFNEDFDLLLRLVKQGYGLIGTDVPGFVRNIGEDSLTRKNRLKALAGARVFLRKAYKEGLLSKFEVGRRLMINYLSSAKELLRVIVSSNIYSIWRN